MNDKTLKNLTHFNAAGQAHMVDVGAKAATHRIAIASGQIHMQEATLAVLQSGNSKKGDVLGIARIAGIQGAKRTAEIIPLCHPLALTHIDIDFDINLHPTYVQCTARAETHGPTGVEMEALCAVNAALLTIYDMLKAIDRSMNLQHVMLLEKHGGRSGSWQRSTLAQTPTK